MDSKPADIVTLAQELTRKIANQLITKASIDEIFHNYTDPMESWTPEVS